MTANKEIFLGKIKRKLGLEVEEPVKMFEDIEISSESETEESSAEKKTTPKKEKRRSFIVDWNNLFGKKVSTPCTSPTRTNPQSETKAEVHNQPSGSGNQVPPPKSPKVEPKVENNNSEDFEIPEAEMEDIKKTLALLAGGKRTFTGNFPFQINKFIRQYEIEGEANGLNQAQLAENFPNVLRAVSYTHLTLPTIYSV